MGGVIGSPSTAYVYDWNMLPIGQALWLKELESYIPYPAARSGAARILSQVYNLDQGHGQTAGRSAPIANPSERDYGRRREEAAG